VQTRKNSLKTPPAARNNLRIVAKIQFTVTSASGSQAWSREKRLDRLDPMPYNGNDVLFGSFLPAAAMSGAVTIRGIAEATGYSRSTVSAALRGRRDIALKTREHICSVAAELGYVQDPELQRLMTHLRKGKSSSNRIPLALLVAYSPGKSWEQAPWNESLWQGVQERCHRLGFSVEVLNQEKVQQRGKELPVVLKARGVQGVILDGSFDPDMAQEAWMDAFSGVRVGTHPWKSRFHSACPDYMYNVQLALDRLLQAGFRRPGLALMSVHQERSDDMFLAGYLSWWARHTELGAPLQTLEYAGEGEGAFRSWLRDQTPDVVLVSDHNVGKWLPEGLRPVHLNLAEDVQGWWGIDQGRERIGEAAVDILSAQFLRGEKGFPEHPRSIMVRGDWVGPT